jgi:DNA-binding CsgD family transcriptional regulator
LTATRALRKVAIQAMNSAVRISPAATGSDSLGSGTLDQEARAILQLLVQGHHTGQIACQLKIPLRRVYWVREKLRQRFGALTNEHMISRAASEGFVNPS